MKKDQIELNTGIFIDLPKMVDSKLLVQANSGGGKSWAIRYILEQSHGKVQQIIIDSEGEFGTLREKYDYILAGKDGDTPAEPKSAALLARKLLELGVSAIIDLYELHPQDRKRFVKLFFDSMINSPKELWHDCLIVLDEAHLYAPEKGQSEAMDAVIGMASLGRKRGFCLIPATQRISKLNKDVAAECNNKLIGRTGLDIDMKRASEELGFTSKEQTQSLRKLKPGDFFAFGPAISDEVIAVTIGSVKTSHPKAGNRALTKITPPTDAIKKILAKLGDIPEQAKKEAQTTQELRDEITLLKTELKNSGQKKPEIDLERELKPHIEAMGMVEEAYKLKIQNYEDYIQNIMDIFGSFTFSLREMTASKPSSNVGASYIRANTYKEGYRKPTVMGIDKGTKGGDKTVIVKATEEGIVAVTDSFVLSGPERKLLDSIAWMESIGISEPEYSAVALLAGYSINGGGFNNLKGSLRTKGFVQYVGGGRISLTEQGRSIAEFPQTKLTSEEIQNAVLKKLSNPEQKLLRALIEVYPNDLSNQELANATGYVNGSGGFSNIRGRLKTLGIIEYPEIGYSRAKDILFIKDYR